MYPHHSSKQRSLACRCISGNSIAERPQQLNPFRNPGASSPFTLAFSQIDCRLLRLIENLARILQVKILPSPLENRFDFGARSVEQHGMNPEPGEKRYSALNFVAASANFRYCRVAPDHGHDALVQISKGLFGLARNGCQ